MMKRIFPKIRLAYLEDLENDPEVSKIIEDANILSRFQIFHTDDKDRWPEGTVSISPNFKIDTVDSLEQNLKKGTPPFIRWGYLYIHGGEGVYEIHPPFSSLGPEGDIIFDRKEKILFFTHRRLINSPQIELVLNNFVKSANFGPGDHDGTFQIDKLIN